MFNLKHSSFGLWAIFVLVSFLSSCEKEQIELMEQEEISSVTTSMDSLPSVVYLDEMDTTEYNFADQSLEARSGQRFQIRAYLYCYRPSDNSFYNNKDEIYFKRTDVSYPKTGPFRRRVMRMDRKLKRSGNPDIWEMGRGNGRNMTLYDTWDLYLPIFNHGMSLEDKSTITLTVAEQDNAQLAAIMNWAWTAASVASGNLTSIWGTGTGVPWYTVKQNVSNGIMDAYSDLRKEGDEVIGTVQVGIARNGNRLELKGYPVKFAYLIRQGTNWVEYRLKGANADYKFRLYLSRV